jgi:hypothetical protein
MVPTMEESFLSGTIRFTPYRLLLHVVLTHAHLTVSCLGNRIIDLPISVISEVKLFDTWLWQGFRVTYQAKPHLRKVFYITTGNDIAWGEAFTQCGITVCPAGGWFEWDGLDSLSQ